MNNDSNRDSEQCTESKLSRVYSAHTLTQVARTLLPGRAHSAVSQRLGLSCHSPPVATQNLCHNTTLAACVACAQRRVASRTRALLCRIAARIVSPCHDTKFCIVTHPQWPGRARAHAALPVRRPVMSHVWLAVS